MIKNLFNVCTLLSLCGLLVACSSRGFIEKKYDEFTKQNICRVDLPRIAVGYGRFASLLIEKNENSNNIKATMLSVDIVAGLFDGNKNFSNNPDIIFDIWTQGKKEQIIFKAQTIDAKVWRECIRTVGCSTHRSASNLFILTQKQLKSISYADSIELTILNGKSSFRSTLSKTEIELLKRFNTECLRSSQ